MSFLLLGARGTGKTWLMQEEFKQQAVLWINLLKHQNFLKYHSNPGLLGQEIEAYIKSASFPEDQHSGKQWIIIDEIQRVPQLLNEVHAIIEDQKFNNIYFGLSGSSARKLKRNSANLLAGRALLNNLYPLLSEEVADDFNLNDALDWGLLPAVVTQKDPLVKRELLETYIAVYLREEIREEQIVRHLDPFTRFLEVAAQSSGKILNYSKIGRDCKVDQRAVTRYFQILEETLLGAFLPAYHRSIRKQQSQSSKFYFFDTGVMRTLEQTISIEIQSGSYGYGRLFEHFLIWEFIKLNEYLRKRYKFSYLSTKDGAEIDLIVERPGLKTILIEIKSGDNPDVSDVRHLMQLNEAFDPCEMWLVSNIKTEKVLKNVEFLNWKTALKRLFA